MISVVLNGEKKSAPAESSLQTAIDQWQLGEKKFAVAVNSQFIPRSQYAEILLKEGDDIELLVPMQGG